MSDRLLIGTSRESAVMKAGKFRFRKGKEKQVSNAGWKDNSLTRKYSSFADLSD